MTASEQGRIGRIRLRRTYGRTFESERTALLVIDPINDFLSEEGATWELTKSTVNEPLETPLLCRSAGQGSRKFELLIRGSKASDQDPWTCTVGGWVRYSYIGLYCC